MEASRHVAGDAKGSDVVCHACLGSSAASSYTGRQNAVGSAQEHSLVSAAQMSCSASTSMSLHLVPHSAICKPEYKWATLPAGFGPLKRVNLD